MARTNLLNKFKRHNYSTRYFALLYTHIHIFKKIHTIKTIKLFKIKKKS